MEDVAGAIVAVAECDFIVPFNIGSGQPVTVCALAGNISAILERPDLLMLDAHPYSPGDLMREVADNSRLRSTGWQARFDLDTGLRQTIDWWRVHLV